jgi:hypothetical protein
MNAFDQQVQCRHLAHDATIYTHPPQDIDGAHEEVFARAYVLD